MSRIDKLFLQYRDHCIQQPITRANTEIMPKITMPGGIALAMSLNK